MSTNDLALWEEWRTRRDPEALGEIISRHSGMVYGTCRRVLGNAADAEDAAQECFLELLKARVKVSDSLAPWLHTIALRRSLDRAKAEGRRKRRERDYVVESRSKDDIELAELLALVDEAIDALPEKLRTPVIERFLEAKTHAAVAERLGLSESTVRYRVKTGLERMRRFLKRRGVGLAAAALATIMETQVAEAAPASLTRFLGRLALCESVSPVSAGVAGASKAAAPWVTVKSGVLAALALVAIPVCLALFALQSGKDPSPALARAAEAEAKTVSEPATVPVAAASEASAKASVSASPSPTASEPAPEPEEPVKHDPASIGGCVYDSSGNPVEGAVVSAISMLGLQGFSEIDSRTVVTNSAGQYAIDDIAFPGYVPGQFSGYLALNVHAEGYASERKRLHLKEGQHVPDASFELSPGVNLYARLLSPSGTPVPFACVACKAAWTRAGGSGIPGNAATTSADGILAMGFRAEGQATLLAFTEEHGETLFTAVPVGSSEVIELRMEEPASLTGRITRSDGTPAASLTVGLDCRFAKQGGAPDYAVQLETWNAMEIGVAYNNVHAKTDAKGYYQFEGLAPGPDFLVRVSTDEGVEDGQPYEKLATKHVGPLSAGESRAFDISLPLKNDQIVVAGRVVGENTGAPLEKVWINLEHVPSGYKCVAISKPSGEFEKIVNTPGKYFMYPFQDKDKGREVTLEAGKKVKLDFVLPEPFSLAVRVVDVEGEPIEGAEVNPFHSWHNTGGTTDAEGRLQWPGFPAGSPAYFQVKKEGFLSNETTPVQGEAGESYPEQVVTLHASGGFEGVLQDETGKPLPNMRVFVEFKAEGLDIRNGGKPLEHFGRPTDTDQTGAFAAASGFPCTSGRLQVGARPGGPGTPWRTSDWIDAETLAGHIVNVGSLQLLPKE